MRNQQASLADYMRNTVTASAVLAAANNGVVEVAVAVGLAARAAANNNIEDLVQATSAAEDHMFFEAMECLEEEPLRGKTDKDVIENEEKKESNNSMEDGMGEESTNDSEGESGDDSEDETSGDSEDEDSDDSDDESGEGSGVDNQKEKCREQLSFTASSTTSITTYFTTSNNSAEKGCMLLWL